MEVGLERKGGVGAGDRIEREGVPSFPGSGRATELWPETVPNASADPAAEGTP